VKIAVGGRHGQKCIPTQDNNNKKKLNTPTKCIKLILIIIYVEI
jgi:hypothetical protein